MAGAAKKVSFRLTAPRVPELALHQQIAQVLSKEIAAPGRMSRHGAYWFSVDIAAYAGSAPGIRTSRGVIAGIPDIHVHYLGRVYLLEVKAADGVLSEAQQGFFATSTWCGVPIAAVRSAAEVLQVLDQWEVPRAHRLRNV